MCKYEIVLKRATKFVPGLARRFVGQNSLKSSSFKFNMVKEQVDLLTQKEASKMVKRSTSSYDVETDKLDLISKYDDTVLTDASLTNTPRCLRTCLNTSKDDNYYVVSHSMEPV